jgi:hypothetical protein
MVMACCSLCYVKYINEDGSIDEEVYKKAVKETIEAGYRVPVHACACKCHYKGSAVRH